MKKEHPIDPSEIKLLKTLRSRPELRELVEQLCSISRDDDDDWGSTWPAILVFVIIIIVASKRIKKFGRR